MDICEEVKKVSIQHALNRSQTKALEMLKEGYPSELQRITDNYQKPHKSMAATVFKDFSQIDLKYLSTGEIKNIAEKAAKKKSLTTFLE